MAITVARTSKLDNVINVDSLHGVTFTNENQGHQFEITCTQGGEEVALTGSISARFLRANQTTVLLTGSIVNGHAVVSLLQDCYNVPGRFQLAVFNTVDGKTTCIYAAVGTVQRTQAGDLIDSGGAVPSLDDLLAQIEACKAAENTANAAAANANNAVSYISGVFSDSKAYSTGDYVVYNGKLYRFTKDHVAGDWASSEVVQVAVGDEIGSLRSALSENSNFQKVFGDINLIPIVREELNNVRGITMTWDGYTATVTGTSTASYSSMLLKIRNLADSVVFHAGETYKIHYSSDNIPVDLYYVNATGKSVLLASIKTDAAFTIPDDAVGFNVRIFMPSSKTFNDQIVYPIVYKDDSNFGISERLNAFETLTDSRIYQNLYAMFYHRNVVPIFEYDGADLKVTINSSIRAVDRGELLAGLTSGTYTISKLQYFVFNVTDRILVVRATAAELLKTDIILFHLTSNSAIVGQWAPFYYIQKNREELEASIAKLKPAEIPDYYFENDYLQNRITAINNIAIGLGRQSFQTFFITDCHWDDNAKLSPLLINYLIDKTGIKNVIFGGDAINKSTVSKADGYKMVCEFLNDFNIFTDKANVYYITGNHEQNDPASNEESLRLNQEVSYRLFNEPVQHKIICMDGTNTFYVDDNCAKIRYICVDSIYSSLISIEARVACFKAMDTVPEGYAFMIFSHTGCAYSGSTVDDFQVTGLTNRFGQIMECAKALNDGVPVEITIGSTTHSYDFTNRPRVFCGAITGHVHFDGYFIYDDRFPVVAITCDTGAYRAKQPARIAGTITEQAFDVVQVDVAAKRLYLTRIGYGEDRVFSFGDAGAGLVA